MRILINNHKTVADILPDISLKWSQWNDITYVGEDVVVFNTLNRTAVLMSKTEYNKEKLTCKKANLYSLGMLVACDVNEQELLNQRYIAGKKDMSDIDLTILLTKNCQFKCSYCFEGSKQSGTLSDTTSDHIMQYLQSFIGICKKLRVTWFGGEPLLGYNQMRLLSHRLIGFCQKNQIEYISDITTNGYAINEHNCKEMIYDLQIKRFIITIDGPESIHNQRRPLLNGNGTFMRIWNNIGRLANEGAQMSIRMTIDKLNVDEIPQLLDKIAQSDMAGKVRLAFCRTIDYGFTPENVKQYIYTSSEFADIEWELLKYARQLGLIQYSFPHSSPIGGCLRRGDIVIGINGEIYKCLDTIGDKKWITGHLTQKYNELATEWYETWLNWTPEESDVCKDCILQPLCNGGCPHNALFREKKHGNDTQCPDWKANYKRQIVEIIKELE